MWCHLDQNCGLQIYSVVQQNVISHFCCMCNYKTSLLLYNQITAFVLKTLRGPLCSCVYNNHYMQLTHRTTANKVNKIEDRKTLIQKSQLQLKKKTGCSKMFRHQVAPWQLRALTPGFFLFSICTYSYVGKVQKFHSGFTAPFSVFLPSSAASPADGYLLSIILETFLQK